MADDISGFILPPNALSSLLFIIIVVILFTIIVNYILITDNIEKEKKLKHHLCQGKPLLTFPSRFFYVVIHNTWAYGFFFGGGGVDIQFSLLCTYI